MFSGAMGLCAAHHQAHSPIHSWLFLNQNQMCFMAEAKKETLKLPWKLVLAESGVWWIIQPPTNTNSRLESIIVARQVDGDGGYIAPLIGIG